jgi:hypothetical protein
MMTLLGWKNVRVIKKEYFSVIPVAFTSAHAGACIISICFISK